MVIAILGILAAVAVPGLVALDTSARTAKIRQLADTLRRAAMLAHGLDVASGSTRSISIEGGPVSLVNGWPDATNTGILMTVGGAALNGSDYYRQSTPTGTGTWRLYSVGGGLNCTALYTGAQPVGLPVIMTVTSASGCAAIR